MEPRLLFEYILVIAWIFGGLLMWPWMRAVLERTDRRLRWLKFVFWGHLILISLAFVFVAYASRTYQRDWEYSLIYPYLIGALSLLLSFGLLFIGRRRRE
jgi:small-conductance mechanosensitive channel